MVCGIFIARPKDDSKVEISQNSNSRLSSDVKVDGVPAQSPVGGRAGVHAIFANESRLGFIPKSPFIYGFRLRECFLQKNQGLSKLYIKGVKMYIGIEIIPNASGQTEEADFVIITRKVD